MSVDPQLRTLEIDIPAQPEVLVKLSLLMAEDEVNLQDMSALIESDMALASSVLKAVNSSLYGLKGRVQSVQQALTYLGMREVAAITFEMSMRAAFPPAPELNPIWERAAERGLLMGHMGQMLGIDPWAAHSAGLFEECGKAVLYRHAPDHYPSMLRAVGQDIDLIQLERRAFGVSHEALGAAMCESWGLSAPAVASVRHHVTVQASGQLPEMMQHPAVCVLSALAQAMLHAPDTVEVLALALIPKTDLDETLVLRAVRRLLEQRQERMAHGG